MKKIRTSDNITVKKPYADGQVQIISNVKIIFAYINFYVQLLIIDIMLYLTQDIT